MGKRNWNLRACARKGHETYAPSESALQARLRIDTAAGEAWRCLRCGDFIVGSPRRAGRAADAPVLLRGHALRDAVILRLLAVERFGRGLLLLAAGYAVVRFKDSQASIADYFEKHLPSWQRVAKQLNYDLDNSGVVHQIRHLLHLTSGTLAWVAVGLFAYAAVQLAEGVGLWKLKRWGEYLTVVATSAFVPLEVYEIVQGVNSFKISLLGLNILAVLYILLSKRLFGLRGGRPAYIAERQSESIIEVELSAALLPEQVADEQGHLAHHAVHGEEWERVDVRADSPPRPASATDAG